MIDKAPYVKVLGFIYRNPAISPKEFQDYWKEVHAPLIKSLLPGLVHYTGSFPLAAKTASDNGPAAFDCLIELCFESVEAMEKALSSPRFGNEDRHISSARFMDVSRTQSLVVEELVVSLD